jgi:hypothetical protein
VAHGLKRRIAFGTTTLTALAAVAFGVAPAQVAADPGRARVADRTPADAGESVKLIANSDFKVTGVCEDRGGGDVKANTFLEAKRNNLSYTTYSQESGYDPYDDDFDKADGPIDFTANDAQGTLPVIDEAEYYEFYAEGGGGRIFRGHVATSVHYKGADCNFGGAFFVGATSGPVEMAPRTEVDAGDTETIYSDDDFKITGTCEDNGGGDFSANTFIDAKRPNLVTYLTDRDEADTDFDPADGPVDMFVDSQEASGTELWIKADSYYNDLFALDAAGHVMQARVSNAVHADGADCAYSAVIVGPASDGALKVTNAVDVKRGKTKTLFKNSDFKVTGKCEDNGGEDFTANTFLRSRRNNLAYYAYDEGSSLDFDSGDKSDFASGDATGTDPDFISVDQYTDFWAEGKGGEGLNGRVASGVHIKGADCTFAGIFVG